MAGIPAHHPHHVTAAERAQHQAQSAAACQGMREQAEAERTGSMDQLVGDGLAKVTKHIPVLGSMVGGAVQHYKDVIHPSATASNADGLRSCVGLATDITSFIPVGKAVSAAEHALPAASRLVAPIGEKLIGKAGSLVEHAGEKAIGALEKHATTLTGAAERAVNKALEHAPKAVEKAVGLAEKQVEKHINPVNYAKTWMQGLDKAVDHQAKAHEHKG